MEEVPATLDLLRQVVLPLPGLLQLLRGGLLPGRLHVRGLDFPSQGVRVPVADALMQTPFHVVVKGSISMPVPCTPRLMAVSAVVPALENGSRTSAPLPDSMSRRAKAVENPSLYFIHRKPTVPLLP